MLERIQLFFLFFFSTCSFPDVKSYLFITVLNIWNLASSGLAALDRVSRYSVLAGSIFLIPHLASFIKKFLTVLCMTWGILCLNSCSVDSKIIWASICLHHSAYNRLKVKFFFLIHDTCMVHAISGHVQHNNKRSFSPTSFLLTGQERNSCEKIECALSCHWKCTDLYNFSELL